MSNCGEWVDPDDAPELGAEWFAQADVRVGGEQIEADYLSFLQRKIDAARLSAERGEGIPDEALEGYFQARHAVLGDQLNVEEEVHEA